MTEKELKESVNANIGNIIILGNRVKELEKKLGLIETYQKTDNKAIRHYEKQIKELEIDLHAHTYNEGYDATIEIQELQEEINELKEKHNKDWEVLDKTFSKVITELKEHDIFKIWDSVRRGGKTTLDAILSDNQRIKELNQQRLLMLEIQQDHREELDELKEQFEIETKIQSINMPVGSLAETNMHDIIRLESVLKKFLKRFESADEVIPRTFYTELLEELSGEKGEKSYSVPKEEKSIVEKNLDCSHYDDPIPNSKPDKPCNNHLLIDSFAEYDKRLATERALAEQRKESSPNDDFIDMGIWNKEDVIKLLEKQKRQLIAEFEKLIDWIEKEYNEQGKISIKHYLERVREKIRKL